MNWSCKEWMLLQFKKLSIIINYKYTMFAVQFLFLAYWFAGLIAGDASDAYYNVWPGWGNLKS